MSKSGFEKGEMLSISWESVGVSLLGCEGNSLDRLLREGATTRHFWTNFVAKQKLTEIRFEFLAHPANSPKLVSSDYHLFPKLPAA